jgi:hypothetical protein
MNQCFVIQPFDNGGKYDKRYNDTFEKAIKTAGYNPYRVDKDPATEIPIEDIDDNIRKSAAVLADITEDNPNVWFEVGLAIAYKKKMVLLCSKERKTKYPFDIQHRSIIGYDTDSSSDFDKLGQAITEKLKTYLSEFNSKLTPFNDKEVLSENILSQESMLFLGSMGNDSTGPFGEVNAFTLVQDFNKAGYTQLGFNFAVKSLLDVQFIEVNQRYDINNEPFATYYSITKAGFEWMEKNKARFNIISENNESCKSEIDNNTAFPKDPPF